MKMKKLVALAIAVSMCLVMTGCSDEPDPVTVPADAAVTEQASETEETEVVQDEPASDAEEVSDTEDGLVPDDTGGEEFVYEEEAISNLCLMGGDYLFKDYTYITNEYNDADGSYYDEYVSEDGVQAVYEKGVKDYNTDIAVEDYILEEATKLAGSGVMNATLEEAFYRDDLSYPAYVAKFYSGTNEDTRSWIVYAVDTDNGLYMYGLSCAADYEEDMFYDADDVFPKLTVEKNYRGLPIDETGVEDAIDLMDFLGSSIDEVCEAIPSVEQDGDQYGASGEKSLDGLSLAGPYFTVDDEGIVTGINYSGGTYCVETMWVGNSMEYSGQYLKDMGWEFSDVDFAHGTVQYVVTYVKDNMELILVSDEEGEFDKDDESDVTGNIAVIMVNLK